VLWTLPCLQSCRPVAYSCVRSTTNTYTPCQILCFFSCWFSPNYKDPFFFYLTSLFSTLQIRGQLGYCKSRSLWPDLLTIQKNLLESNALDSFKKHRITCTTSNQCPVSCNSSCTLMSFSPNPSLPSQKNGGMYYVYPLQSSVKDGSAGNKSDSV
jgi:hypothetical protein